MSAPIFTLLWYITLHYTLHGQRCQNGFYFSNKLTISDDSIAGLTTRATDLNVAFRTHIYPVIRAFQNQAVIYNAQICTTLIPKNGPIHEIGILSENGDQGDESLPSYCAAIIKLQTGLAGKSNRGRLYIAGVAENDSLGSELSPDATFSLNNIGNELITKFGPAGSNAFARYVVFSRKLGYTPVGNFSVAGIKPIITWTARKTLGTQRHRLIGKGN